MTSAEGRTQNSIFLQETFVGRLGGGGGEGLHKNISQTIATINFSSRGVNGKTL